MALFKRADLREQGFTDEQIDYIMTQSQKVLTEYTANTTVADQIAKAVKEAKDNIPAPQKVEESEEYKTLVRENSKLKTLNTATFDVVKKPYRDMVWDRLDHGEKHKDYAEQLTELAQTMPDIFEKPAQEDAEQAEGDKKPKPQFASGDKGSMPTGDKKPSFGDAWGFVPKTQN